MLTTSATVDRLYGKYPGVVEDNKPTGPPEEYQGDIVVRVSSILNDDDQPLQVIAKPCFHPGFFFIPEVGDQVWVEFVGGDMNHAIWTGVWYPKKKTPGRASGDAPDHQRNVIRTASDHVIEISDADDDQKIVIKHNNGSTIEMNSAGSLLIANQAGAFLYLNAEDQETTLMDQLGNLVTMTENCLLASNKDGTNIELKDGAVKITASDAVQLMAKDVVVNSSTVSLAQGANQSAVLGEIFAAMYNTHTHPTALGPSGPPVPAPLPLGSLPAGMGLSRSVKVGN